MPNIYRTGMRSGGTIKPLAENKSLASVYCTLGFSIYWTWLLFVLLTGFFSNTHSSPVFDSAWFWSTLGHIAALTLLGALSNQYSPYSSNKIVLLGSPLISILGFAAILYANMLGGESSGAFMFGAITIGIGTSGQLVCWCELYSSLYTNNKKRMIIAVGILVSEVLFLAIAMLPRQTMVAVLFAMPLLAVACVYRGLGKIESTALKQETEEGKLSPRFALFCLVYSIPLGFFQVRFLFGAENAAWSWVTTIGLSLVVLIALVVADGLIASKRDTSLIPKVVIPVAIGGLLLIATFGDERAAISGILVYSAHQLLTILLYSEFAKIAHSGRSHAARIFALGVCLTDGGFILGMLTAEVSLTFLSGFYLELTLGVVYVVALAGFLLMPRFPTETMLENGVAPESTGPAKGSPALSASMQKKIDRAASAYSLTAREIEMLQYILRGKSVPAIAAETYLSRNTVKTHIVHIYQKLDVHSRDELIVFIENVDLDDINR